MKVLWRKRRNWAWPTLALFLAVGLKVWLILGDWMPFNSDEAIVALMARHILLGKLPVFFYGQAYMGSLDAFLVAGAFILFGEQVWAIRVVQGLLYLGVMCTTACIGKRVFGFWQVGILAMFLLAIPTVNVTLYTTVSLGGYGEALLFGNLIILLGLRIAKDIRSKDAPGSFWRWLGLGFLSGFGLWIFGLTLVFSLRNDGITLGFSLFRSFLLDFLSNAISFNYGLFSKFTERCKVLVGTCHFVMLFDEFVYSQRYLSLIQPVSNS